MFRANPSEAVVRKQVESVQFGFYNDQDVRDRSVVEITCPTAFDPNHTPLPAGLYDPRMGPVQASDGSCITCALPHSACPGHFGHIELAVPVYHPLLLAELIAALRTKCLACHHLKAAPPQLLQAQAKFGLLLTERFAELAELDDVLATKMQQARQHVLLMEEEGEAGGRGGGSGSSNKHKPKAAAQKAMEEHLKTIIQETTEQQRQHAAAAAAVATSNKRKNKHSSYYKQQRKLLQHETLSMLKSCTKCHHCGAMPPKIRHDSYNKIFQAALSKQHARINQAEGIVFRSALDDDVTKMAATTAASSGGTHNNNNNQTITGYDSEDTDREEEDLMDVMVVDDEAEEDNNQNDEESSSEDEDDDSDGDGGSAVVRKGKNKTQQQQQQQRDKYLHPGEVQAQLKRTWELETFLCNCLFGSMDSTEYATRKDGYQLFFLQAIPVPPSRFRPPMHLGGMAVEHGQTQSLSKIMQLNEAIRRHFCQAGHESRAYTAWIDLQTEVNCFMDASKDPSAAASALNSGIKQILERKEGLFRKNMMGKRVDYACRSVISPDPYVGTNEIGLPYYFATVLTYPTPVTDLNSKEMRQLVERGPDNYPGARWVEINGRRVDLSKMNHHRRQAVAAQLLTHMKRGGMPAIVGRQLRDGDYVLMNRQPTLHKPGIMAHRVRVLYNRDQRTIRMHYANCNTYNADFDGDEMNCHFPQSDLAQAEAQYIARTDLQYIVPTDGSPLRGLIQDHVVGGVKLTKKDTFLEKWEYQQLVFAALASLPGLEVIRYDMDIEILPPAIQKPRELWTGKQVISTLLLHLSRGHDRDGPKTSNLPGLSCERKAKTPESAFGAEQEEHLVLIRDGELLRGILDKSAFGSTNFSLVHAVYEAYGPEKAGLLLNSLGRLFTAYIQSYSGHSCRVEDLVLTKESDADRRKLVQRAFTLGSRAAKAWADSDGGKVSIPSVSDQASGDRPLKPVEVAAASAKIGELLSGNEGKDNFAALDAYMQGQLNPLSSAIVKQCLPGGLAVPFPYNTFGVMTTTGAKGSIVNQSQVTCALGQQALEGRRVPRMSSGRTLPSFAPYDPNPRADGFVMDRFLTGIRPQEYYFHCMAGREGLVDTAVKTSRSGYLQRCLVKHLEELKTCYDHTVRNAEGAVVQFLYGEDGLDTTKASYLDCSMKSFEYIARNNQALERHNTSLPSSTIAIAATDAARNASIEHTSGKYFVKGEFVLAKRLRIGNHWTRGALLQGWNRAVVTKVHKNGSVDLKYLADGYTANRVPIEVDFGRCGGREEIALSSTATIVKHAVQDPILSSIERGHRLGSSGACVSERVAKTANEAMEKNKSLKRIMSSIGLSKDDLSGLIAAKYSNSLCAPGEAVGSIAAQSIGEPSTQMTLNTFHLAGAGANVTLGIPRLREIIMTASRELKTPTMSAPLASFVTDKEAVRLTRDFTRLSLMELISGDRGVSVTERLERVSGIWERAYYVVLKFHPAERISEAFGLSLHDIAKVVANSFVPLLAQNMKKELRRSAADGDVGVTDVSGGSPTEYLDAKEDGENESGGDRPEPRDELNDDDGDEERDEDVPGDEDGLEASRFRRRKESVSYESDDEEEKNESTDEEMEENELSSETIQTPETSVLEASPTQMSPKIDKKSNSIILQPLRVDPATRPLLMVGLIEKAAESTLVRSRKNIEQAFINDEGGRGKCLQTAGINLEEMWKLESIEHNSLVSNDIWAVRCSYGVEAARNSIVNQITSVFGAYGIEVDPRHLALIADYMTFDGSFKPMNRIGMEAASSTLLQMSFETTVHFLKQAALAQAEDIMSSPSANIVVGRPIKHGTGSFALLACNT